MLERKLRKDSIAVTFALPADVPAGPVSVVGDFNGWTPGAHPLKDRKGGLRAVTVNLPSGQRHAFRYLAAGGHWFDDDTADAHDGRNGHIHT
ncbi:isoamylase early set domain-containing protein [Streptomyces sp. NBC_00190]|uniref:isoamylase early set domain-containing protein n=1 Tax=unclassified Streptomyces TaxID=2593676 RepID=UPI002E295CE8|nr:isoamylase early set domain-containing protein [Streptomyces sp. NBC_00190]WSZ38528.1 isoamylase early set domain-containing protein [Streptomyces sp. NBC_00868]